MSWKVGGSKSGRQPRSRSSTQVGPGLEEEQAMSAAASAAVVHSVILRTADQPAEERLPLLRFERRRSIGRHPALEDLAQDRARLPEHACVGREVLRALRPARPMARYASLGEDGNHLIRIQRLRVGTLGGKVVGT